MIATVARLSQAEGVDLGLRVGVHSGPVVAGVLGRKRPHYDIWGGTVNMAHRLQATAPRGQVQIAGSSRALIGDRFAVTPRGTVDMKGLGAVPCWLVAPATCSIPSQRPVDA